MQNPKLFISYSWSSPEHESLVLNLATALRENGVDVIFDKWDLKDGHDANAFMEKMVTDEEIKKVIIVCDKMYADKSNKRKGGVGTEAQIISSELYQKVKQDKFVAVIAEKDEEGKPYLPVYYQSRIYIDLGESDLYTENFDRLLRWIFNKPLYIKPDIGEKPFFLSDDESINLGTTSKFKRANDALRTGKSYFKPAVIEYLDLFFTNLEKFRITQKEGEFDELVVKNIEQFIPYRNEFIEILKTIAVYQNNKEMAEIIHEFFEKLTVYLDRPENVSSCHSIDFDNFIFIIHELFLYCIAILINNKCFEIVSYLLSIRYFIKSNYNYGENILVTFQIFRGYLESLAIRNKRLKLNRISLHADFLKNRNTGTDINFEKIMQADFILFIRDCIDSFRTEDYRYRWYPYTLLYRMGGAPFELFARAASKSYFNRIKIIFDIDQPDEFEIVWRAFNDSKANLPNFDYHIFHPLQLINYSKLATII